MSTQSKDTCLDIDSSPIEVVEIPMLRNIKSLISYLSVEHPMEAIINEDNKFLNSIFGELGLDFALPEYYDSREPIPEFRYQFLKPSVSSE